MKDKISAERFLKQEGIHAERANMYFTSTKQLSENVMQSRVIPVTSLMESYTQQSLHQILEEAGEELPDDEVIKARYKFDSILNPEESAKWMRSEASKVVARLKEEVKDKISGWERCAKALDATSKDLNRCRAEIQQLKEELAKK